MRTIGHNRPHTSPRGDYATRCDYCGVRYLRSQLRKDGAGLLACPDEGNGADMVTLAKANAQAARRPMAKPTDGGGTFRAATDDTQHILDLDLSPAEILARTPAHLATVSAPAALVVRWSKWVNAGDGDLVIHDRSDGSVVQALAAAGMTRDGWTTTHAVAALPAGAYYVLIDADAFVDLNGLAFVGIDDPSVWRFSVT